MIATWMAWAVALAALLAVAALAAERACLALRRPTRGAWAAAMLLSVVLPPLAWWGARAAATPGPLSTLAGGAPAVGGAAVPGWLLAALAGARETPAVIARLDALDRPLLAAWGLAALAGLAWLLREDGRFRRRARRWPARRVRGATVHLAPDAAMPAAFGAWRARVVLPAWMRDDARRALVLAHEGEHVRAADPRLLAVGALLVALAPWNPALWWQLRRLRAAVEVDCDRRVLARHPDVRRYGRLLLDVAARAAGPGALAGSYALAPSFALTLDRRIRTMTSRPPRRPLAHAASALVGALAVLAAAAALPRPAAAVDAASDLRVTAAPTAAAQDSTRPLMLVNGREVSPDSPEANPAPDRIERVDVLKGETAIARYGARGRHGVILITMKPGAAATGESSTAREASPERLDVRRREIADQQVLWVVNGRVIPPPPGRTHSDGPPESLPQADRIARVNVLKGEAARRKYGERVPRDGVVEITTKAASETY